MSSTEATARDTDAAARDATDLIRARLAETRRQLKFVDVGSALISLMAVVLVYLLAVACIDHWVIGLSPGMRFAALVVLIVGSIVFAVWRLSGPIRRSVNPMYAAHTIEQAEPSLKNSLINLLWLSKRRDSVPPVIYNGLRRQAAGELASVPTETLVDRAPLIYAGYALIAALALSALYTVFSPKDPLQTVARIAAPWKAIARPSRVEIDLVEPGDAKVYRGQSLTVTARVAGLRDQESVELVFTTDDRQFVEHRIEFAWDDSGRFRAELTSGRHGLQQPLEYWVVAGDAESERFRVDVVDAPHIDVSSLEYQFPDYTGMSPTRVEDVFDIQAVEGTRVTIRGRANQEIRNAFVELYQSSAKDATDAIRSLPMPHQLDQAEAKITLALLPDRSTPQASAYQLRFTTNDGQRNLKPIRHQIEVVPDLVPEIEVLQPQERQFELETTASADFEVRAIDPDFGIRNLRVVGAVAGRERIRTELKLESTDVQGQLIQTFQLRPADYQFQPGDRLLLWFEVADNRHDPRGQWSPNTARTDNFRIRITEPDRQAPRSDSDGDGQADSNADGTPQGENQAGENASEENGQAGNQGTGDRQQGDEQGQGEQGQGEQGQGEQGQGEQGQGEQGHGEQDAERGEGQSAGTDRADGSATESSEPSEGAQRGNEANRDSQGQDSQDPGSRDSNSSGSPNGASGDSDSTPSDSGDGEPVASDGSNDGDAFERILRHRQREQEGGQPDDGQGADREPGSGNEQPTEAEASETESTQRESGGSESDAREEPSQESGRNPDSDGPSEPDSSEGQGTESRPATGAAESDADSGADGQRRDGDGGSKSDGRRRSESPRGNEDAQPIGDSSDPRSDGTNANNQGRDSARQSDSDRSDPSSDSARANPNSRSDEPSEDGSTRGSGGDNDSNRNELDPRRDDLANGDSANGDSANNAQRGDDRPSSESEQSSGSGDSDAATDNQSGEGEQSTESGTGETSDGRDPESEASKNGRQPENPNANGPESQAGGRPEGDRPENASDGPGGGRVGDGTAVPEDSSGQGGDEANLEYARRATDLALDHLKHHTNDQQLLDELGWTPEEAQSFLKRWEQLRRSTQQPGQSGDRARQLLTEQLRSLGVRPPSAKIRRETSSKDTLRDLRNLGSRTRVPAEYREQFRAFLKGADDETP